MEKLWSVRVCFGTSLGTEAPRVEYLVQLVSLFCYDMIIHMMKCGLY